MMSFTGKVGRDIETLQQNAASVAVAALRATSVPEVKRLGDVLAAHTARRGRLNGNVVACTEGASVTCTSAAIGTR